jgi:hypothetical protein
VDIPKFFQIGWKVMESESAETYQHVITKLGAETVLTIIKKLTDTIDTNLKFETTVSIFRENSSFL